jgi:hypothetical protein
MTDIIAWTLFIPVILLTIVVALIWRVVEPLTKRVDEKVAESNGRHAVDPRALIFPHPRSGVRLSGTG